MTELIYQLIYCSRNAIDEHCADVDREIDLILKQARENNARDGITGALVFSAGSFAQVLEGPLAPLERTFERIQRDLRHGNVVVLGMRPAVRRDFADWSMAFAGRLSDPDAASRLADACDVAGQDGSAAVLEVLHDLVQREEDWVALA